MSEALEEWRAARQDIFDNNMAEIIDKNKARWARLAAAEHKLMDFARARQK